MLPNTAISMSLLLIVLLSRTVVGRGVGIMLSPSVSASACMMAEGTPRRIRAMNPSICFGALEASPGHLVTVSGRKKHVMDHGPMQLSRCCSLRLRAKLVWRRKETSPNADALQCFFL